MFIGTRGLAAAVGLAFCANAVSAALPLRAGAWLAPDADRIAALTTAPAECFRTPRDPAIAAAAQAGRIVFRSPLLLGGPAAKSGLSCQSCHVNGHANPDFHAPGLSGAPGTADVSSHLFSKKRGDGVFNPKKIPSLLDLARIEKSGEPDRIPGLSSFVRSVIVDEFQGASPAPSVFAALLAYVSALDVEACPPQRIVPIRLASEWAVIRSGAAALQATVQSGDAGLADFLLASLRVLLGEVHERFDRPELEQARALLLGLSRELGELRQAPLSASALATWRVRLDQTGGVLQALESRSLYDPANLRKTAATPPRYEHVKPSADGIGKVYMGREIARIMGWQGADWLERDSREKQERSGALVEQLKLKPGMAIADIGAGTGYYARRFSKAVGPQGLVYAVDVQPQMLEKLQALAKGSEFTNIRPVLGTADEVRLADNSVDLAIMIDVYHELEFPYEVLSSIVRALRPQGLLVFVEYKAEDASVAIKPLHKMSVAQIKREAAQHPLVLERSVTSQPLQHVLIFRKS